MIAPAMALDPTDVVGRRIGAYFIDALVGFLLLLAIAGPSVSRNADQVDISGRSGYCSTVNDAPGNRLCMAVGNTAYVMREDQLRTFQTRIGLTALTWLLLNSVILQGLAGGTIGKLLVGLRVVRNDGRRAGMGWCGLRTLLLPLDAACCGVIGLATSLTTAGHRRVGDMAASTLVVPRSSEGHPIPVPGLTGGVSTPYVAPPGSAGGPGFGVTPPMARDGGDGPTWDPARNAYIQYDRGQAAWLQWNDDDKAWRPIEQA